MRNERYPLIGARIKLERASKHIEVFSDLFREFVKSDAYTIRVRKDADGREHREHILGREVFWGGPVWSNLCCTAGDAVHNMRSALDHVAYAVARSKRVPSRDLKKIAFTIACSRNTFIGAIKRQKLSAVGIDWIEFLRNRQPYYRRNGKTLLRLSELDNMDKHRELLSLAPIASVAVQIGNQPAQHVIASLKKGVMIPPADKDGSFSIVHPYITLANTVPYEKRLEATSELLDFRTAVSHIVTDAQKKFFA